MELRGQFGGGFRKCLYLHQYYSSYVDFEPTLAYEVKVQASNYLSVYERPLRVVSLNFNIIDDIQIENEYYVQLAIE